jgi:hypothetical protein
VVPSETETVISQLARTVYDGRGLPYLLVMVATTVILIMAANTAFADFPRLSALLAADGYLPRQMTYRGSRLVYSHGIEVLALIAALLIIIFNASVTALIPLYAIGVFLSFTLSQSGMARRWRKIGHLALGQEKQERGSTLHHDPKWKSKMIVNGFGAVCTAIVMMVFAVTKFETGAWLVLIIIPTLVFMFARVHHHYRDVASHLTLEKYDVPLRTRRHRVLVPISGVHRGTLAALRYARTLSTDLTAVHVSIDEAEAEKIKRKWETWGDGVRLVILDSPFRLLLEPVIEYVEMVDDALQPNETLTIVVPQFVPRHWWENLLHTQAASMLRNALLHKPGIVIVNVPYQLDPEAWSETESQSGAKA